MFAHSAELVNRRRSGNDGVVADFDVAGEGNGIREDDVTTDLTIVRHVRVAEKQTMRTDPGHGIRVSAAVNGAVFPENVVIANFQVRRIARVFEILRLSSHGGEGEELIAASEFRMTFEHHMRVEDTIIAKLDICADDTERADADIASQRREG